MQIHFIPSQKNNFTATLLKKKFLAVMAVGILIFNLVVPVNINAAAADQVLNSNNLVNKHNNERLKNGLSKIKINQQLTLSAQNKANDMLRNNCWSHYCPDGRSPWEYFKDVEYDYIFAGENLAEGFYTIDTVMSAWMNSPTHKENILRDKYTEVGFGFAYGNFQNNTDNLIVVVHFGTQSSNAIFSDNEKNIKITSPDTNQVITTLPIDVTGMAESINILNVFNNDSFISTENVNEGIFTFKITNINEGENVLKIRGINSDNKELESEVKYFFNQQVAGIQSEGIAGLSPAQKNMVNIGFIIFFFILFFLDFIFITRTQAIKKVKSYSHYHLGIFLILGIIATVGGLAGSIGNGLFS
jgi:hypothetical protein